MAMAIEELRMKRAQRASLGRSIAKLKKTLQSAQAAWTTSEQSDRQAQLDGALREVARIDQELVALKRHLRLLKIKQTLIAL